MIIWVYRLLILPFFILMLPYYLKRMLKRGGYGQDFHHRFGFVRKMGPKKAGVTRIWLHAVSVGEIRAIGPLIDGLRDVYGAEIILTTTTSTGYKMAGELYGDKVANVDLFPIDFWLFSKIAWGRFKPDVAILMESEIWPEHVRQAKTHNVPVILINARLSDRSFRRYLKFKWLAKGLLSQFSLILAATAQDAERYVKIGAPAECVKATGNIKLDVKMAKILSDGEKKKLSEEMGFGMNDDGVPPTLLMGSSTWPGEEAMLLDILKDALDEGMNCRLVIVPRHPERRKEIEELLSKQKLPYHMRSKGKQADNGCYVYIGDTMGELTLLSQVADVAFIGKSMPPHAGGQTPIEAAALGIPIVYGPRMSNFRQVSRALEAEGAALLCQDAAQLKDTVLDLLQNTNKRTLMREAAKRWHENNQGAAQRTIECLKPFVSE